MGGEDWVKMSATLVEGNGDFQNFYVLLAYKKIQIKPLIKFKEKKDFMKVSFCEVRKCHRFSNSFVCLIHYIFINRKTYFLTLYPKKNPYFYIYRHMHTNPFVYNTKFNKNTNFQNIHILQIWNYSS